VTKRLRVAPLETGIIPRGDSPWGSGPVSEMGIFDQSSHKRWQKEKRNSKREKQRPQRDRGARRAEGPGAGGSSVSLTGPESVIRKPYSKTIVGTVSFGEREDLGRRPGGATPIGIATPTREAIIYSRGEIKRTEEVSKARSGRKRKRGKSR